MKNVFLVCNSHLDPIYLWELKEGIVEAISTYRVAADICEQYDNFVFNHNEVLLYEYCRIHEPSLFERIKRLVAQGRWHIMGGWYLQPDCNIPSGEGFVRQIYAGKRYFQEHFNCYPTTAMNFDSFGHTRGLVQILAKSGFDSYIFCRPIASECELPAEDFRWIGFDGSSVIAHRSLEHYNTPRGWARGHIEGWLEYHPDQDDIVYLWGIGNHGGGVSRIDVEQINDFIATSSDNIRHAKLDDYFEAIKDKNLPEYSKDLNPVAQGSYTNLIRIKQKYRQLESWLFLTEKMASHAALAGLIDYPQEDLLEAEKDMLLGQFHDVLPGSVIRNGEQEVLQMLDHGLEILSRVQFKAFFAMTAGQAPMDTGITPIFAYNPHPYPVSGVFECEYGLPPDHNAGIFEGDNLGDAAMDVKDMIVVPMVYRDDTLIPSQLEHHHSHKHFEFRKRSAFYATLPPASMTRFDCRFVRRPLKSVWEYPDNDSQEDITVDNGRMQMSVSRQTGLLQSYRIDGKEYLQDDAFQLLVMEDNYDAYGWGADKFDNVLGKFRLMTLEQATEFRGFNVPTAPVRVIEDGDARKVVEALFIHDTSAARLLYKMNKQGTAFEIELAVYWNEKGRLLKLAVPTTIKDGEYWGQTAYGSHKLAMEQKEVCSQKWAGLYSGDSAITWCGDSGYGSSCDHGEFRMTLLRSPLYLSGEFHPEKPPNKERFYMRSDQGERVFRFLINGGPAKERRHEIEREAIAFHEAPYLLSLNPSGLGEKIKAALHLDNTSIQVAAFKQKVDSKDYIIRLFETTGHKNSATLSIPLLDLSFPCTFEGYEIKTLVLSGDKTPAQLTELNGLDV